MQSLSKLRRESMIQSIVAVIILSRAVVVVAVVVIPARRPTVVGLTREVGRLLVRAVPADMTLLIAIVADRPTILVWHVRDRQ